MTCALKEMNKVIAAGGKLAPEVVWKRVFEEMILMLRSG